LVIPPPSTNNIRLDRIPEKNFSTNYAFILAHFHEILNSFHDALICYTDGSRTRNRVGAAYSIGDKLHGFRLRNSASIFTAELLAIYHCFQIISRKPSPLPLSVLIIADARSALTAITNPYSSHPVVSRIFTLLSTLQSGPLTVSFLWVPSDKGTSGNAKVDAATKSATERLRISLLSLLPKADITLAIRNFIKQHWTTLWRDQISANNKLVQFKSLPLPWSSSQETSRRTEIVLSRLRIGHTRLTHSHLFTNLFPLSCPHCPSDQPITIQHMFSCPH